MAFGSRADPLLAETARAAFLTVEVHCAKGVYTLPRLVVHPIVKGAARHVRSNEAARGARVASAVRGIAHALAMRLPRFAAFMVTRGTPLWLWLLLADPETLHGR